MFLQVPEIFVADYACPVPVSNRKLENPLDQDLEHRGVSEKNKSRQNDYLSAVLSIVLALLLERGPVEPGRTEDLCIVRNTTEKTEGIQAPSTRYAVPDSIYADS